MTISRFAQFQTLQIGFPTVLPPNLRIYAIGDIHGRADLLDALARQIEDELASAPTETLTIFLGDYVDRGLQSSTVVEWLSRGDFPTPFHALRGNHEEILLRFLDDDSVLDGWRKFGGVETLHSYGVDVSSVMRGKGYEEARRALVARFPDHHRQFVVETPLTASYGDYFFCHAGVKPGVPLRDQKAEDLLWIREEFLNFRGNWEKLIVHGHTPVSEPEVLPNRINIDTGAFATSVLTALVLEGDSRRMLFTGRN
ncbi:serine/threonine protein phosphatase [Methylosinus sp. H3A]|uniref:metallophosphoesterase family protein n=1 Tax=Methylosinus sp. H3A TaxID=2785786 RepID=UPI0018C24747|nr:metallophosphoesterase family protein [Methylosinus sp. H3A]MBG0811736.1 serine/threonine protein phosphatase [Methylosinus sp. H3A]